MEQEYYSSKYFTAEQMDQRLLKGTYDDAVVAGYQGTKEEFDHQLATVVSTGLTKIDIVQELGESEDKMLSQKAIDSAFAENTTYKILTWDTDFSTTRKQVPQKERKKGLRIRYAINNTEWVEEVYKGSNYSDSSWASDSSWDYEKFKGEITSVTQSPSLDTRTGVYYTSCIKGKFVNFIRVNSNNEPITQLDDRYFTILNHNGSTNGWLLSDLQPILRGNDYLWGRIHKGYINITPSSRREDNVTYYKYTLEVFPNTIILPINAVVGELYSIQLKQGVFEFESIHNNMLFMVDLSTGNIISQTPAGTVNNNTKNFFPSYPNRNKHLILGACGAQWAAQTDKSFFPFVGMHANIKYNWSDANLSSPSDICCLNDYTFYSITDKVKNLTFKGACLLDLLDTDEDNVYYILGTTEAGTYTFSNIPVTVTTEKNYSAFAIKKKDGIWSSEEVPLSFCGQRNDAPYHIVRSGVYVIHPSYSPNSYCWYTETVRGIHGIGDVQLIMLGDGMTLGDWYNVKVYGSTFNDYYQRDNNVRIENCEFTGPYWRTTESTYFINCHFNKKWYSNVLIKNCKFTFDRMYTYICGDWFNNVEITGCEFSVKQGSHPIRINKFLSSAIVRGNKVFGGVTGIFFGSQKSLPQSGAIVENNTVMYQSEEGISCDGFGNNYGLVPVIANGNIEQVYNDENGRLVVKPHLYTGTSASDAALVDYPISKINNWKDYYVTFNRGTGIDGTICRIYDYDANSNTFTLDIYISSEKIRTTQSVPKLGNGSSDDSIIGVQSGFFDMVVRNNILKSDRQDYCTALSNYLNVFNTLIENNKVYLMNSFMNIAGGNMLGVMETLCWGVKVINNTFMNCNAGTFTSYWDGKLPQFNNVFQGNILKNVKNFGATGQRNFVLKDNVWDNVDNSSIKNCESYVPSEDDLKVHQMGTIYNKFVNDPATLLLQNIEPYIVERNEENVLHLKKL